MIFQDPLMKIFVVSELMRLKRIELGPYKSFHERQLGRPHDTRVDGFRANPTALDYFARLSSPPTTWLQSSSSISTAAIRSFDTSTRIGKATPTESTR